jgi:hypothetical protein
LSVGTAFLPILLPFLFSECDELHHFSNYKMLQTVNTQQHQPTFSLTLWLPFNWQSMNLRPDDANLYPQIRIIPRDFLEHTYDMLPGIFGLSDSCTLGLESTSLPPVILDDDHVTQGLCRLLSRHLLLNSLSPHTHQSRAKMLIVSSPLQGVYKSISTHPQNTHERNPFSTFASLIVLVISHQFSIGLIIFHIYSGTF